jgi:Family of unknown function (DUF6958)
MFAQKATAAKPHQSGNKISEENVNLPGHTNRVDATMYHAMRQAMLKALPAEAPDLTQDEMIRAVKPFLPEDLFPGGAKVDWWAKTVQLDLEAKKILVREAIKPLRWHRLS